MAAATGPKTDLQSRFGRQTGAVADAPCLCSYPRVKVMIGVSMPFPTGTFYSGMDSEYHQWFDSHTPFHSLPMRGHTKTLSTRSWSDPLWEFQT